MRIFEKFKKAYDNYIERISEINEKEFKGGKLDCCKLNNNEKQVKR